MITTQAARQETSRYDDGARRKSVRKGAERGVWIFIPAAELRKAGIDPHGPVPRYRLWGRARGSVLLRLYANPNTV